MSYRHRLFGKSTYTGSDTLKFYDTGDQHIAIVHVQEWDDLIGERERKSDGLPKYNAVAHLVCARGFESYGREPSYYGDSVVQALRSCGYVLTPDSLSDTITISSTYDGSVVARGTFDDIAVKLVIAECMYSSGTGDRVSEESGNNARELERNARRSF